MAEVIVRLNQSGELFLLIESSYSEEDGSRTHIIERPTITGNKVTIAVAPSQIEYLTINGIRTYLSHDKSTICPS